MNIRFCRRILVLFVSSFIVFSAQFALADNVAGKVIKTTGTATAKSPDEKIRTLKRGETIHVKETITTEPKSSVSLRYSDGTLVEIQGGSEYIIDDYEYIEAEPEEDVFSVSLIKGGFRAITGEINERNPDTMETKARMTTLTVRGSLPAIFLSACSSVSVMGKVTTVCPGPNVFMWEGYATLKRGNRIFEIPPGTGGTISSDGSFTGTTTPPPGTGNDAYSTPTTEFKAVSLSPVDSSGLVAEPATVSDPALELDSSSQTTDVKGTQSGGAGGGDPCGDLNAIKNAL